MREVIVTCDGCEEELTNENKITIYIMPKKSKIEFLGTHELCDKCYKEFLTLMKKYKE